MGAFISAKKLIQGKETKMIRKLEVEEIAGIMQLEDNVMESFPCDKGEWVQWLISNVENPGILIIGNVMDGEIKSHLVAHDSVMLPLSAHVSILFFYSGSDTDSNMEIRDMLNDWARAKGAKAIRFICRDMAVFEKYGAEQVGILGGWSL